MIEQYIGLQGIVRHHSGCSTAQVGSPAQQPFPCLDAADKAGTQGPRTTVCDSHRVSLLGTTGPLLQAPSLVPSLTQGSTYNPACRHETGQHNTGYESKYCGGSSARSHAYHAPHVNTLASTCALRVGSTNSQSLPHVSWALTVYTHINTRSCHTTADLAAAAGAAGGTLSL